MTFGLFVFGWRFNSHFYSKFCQICGETKENKKKKKKTSPELKWSNEKEQEKKIDDL